MSQAAVAGSQRTVFPVLGAVSLCHMLNDMMQTLFTAMYPVIKGGFDLSFGQIGVLTMVFQVTASLLQPAVGRFTDQHPLPYALPSAMLFTMAGLLTLGLADSYAGLLAGAAALGMGSSIFHPESSRIARLASGGQHGMAQSVFQVGGNFGQAVGPLMAAFLLVPHGRASMAWFAAVALGTAGILWTLANWYKAQKRPAKRAGAAAGNGLCAADVKRAMIVLVALMFSKFFYLSSFINYYIFFLMARFHLGTQAAQVDLFVFMAASAAGTVIGGPVGDRVGRKRVIWASIAGIVPFTLVLPYASLPVTIGLSVIVGFVLSSAFSAIVVYAQELMPGQVGMVSGLMFGLAFGLGGVGAALLGWLADATSIALVYQLCAFLPLIGFATVLLPDLEGK